MHNQNCSVCVCVPRFMLGPGGFRSTVLARVPSCPPAPVPVTRASASRSVLTFTFPLCNCFQLLHLCGITFVVLLTDLMVVLRFGTEEVGRLGAVAQPSPVVPESGVECSTIWRMLQAVGAAPPGMREGVLWLPEVRHALTPVNP